MKKLALLATLAITGAAANAATVIVDTTPANNQANAFLDAGQTFTTAALGADNALSSIAVLGPQSGAVLTTYTANVYVDNDGDFSTWDPGALVAISTNTIPIDTNNALHTFTFSNEILMDSTVYAISFNDGTNDHATFRAGLTNGAEAIADGALFSAGVQPFGGAFDASLQVTTTAVPEPSASILAGLACLGLLRRRR